MRRVGGHLAAESHLTPGHLVRLFKDATGLPLMAYLARSRGAVRIISARRSRKKETALYEG